MPVRRPRIVLVDLDDETRDVIQQALEKQKYQVYATDSYNEGGSLAMRLKPSLIVMGADGEDGMTTFKNLRRLRRHIPILGIPSSGGDIPAMLREGAVWAQDKFYIAQGMEERPHDPKTKDIAQQFLQQVSELTHHHRAL